MALKVNAAALEALYRSPRVASVELDAANEPFMASSNPVIGAPAAWDAGFDGSGWAVAVLDSGVDVTHPWFNTTGSKILSEACYSGAGGGSFCPGLARTSTDPNSGDDCGSPSGCDHGTHVAGTVAGNDGGGPNFGVARGAGLVAVQVFSRIDDTAVCGSTPAPCITAYNSDIILGLERVLELTGTLNIAAANMSLGGGGYLTSAACDAAFPTMKLAIDNLRAANVATVISSGNNGYINGISAPACISSAVSVGATTDGDALASFSNVYEEIDLLAPGVSIESAVPGVGTAFKQGTSMAAPHVAGAWAVLRQAWPSATVDDIETILKATGTPVNDWRGGAVTGMPRINLDLALAEVQQAGQASLSGTVVDAADGATPVSPVFVMVVDPASGEGTHYGVTDADGNYSIPGIPPGSWKVLFTAYDGANGYGDELYDGIPCDGAGCDRVALGTLFAIAPGENTLDVDLQRYPLLSGAVTGPAGEPLQGVQVQLLDADGLQVGSTAWTNAAGLWSQPVPANGTYFARTLSGGARAYLHEAWDDVPCDGCDPTSVGSPIAVSSDTFDIDFQLDYGGGTLQGTVTDAEGPLHPVDVQLLDPASGMPIDGLAASNEPDGSYTIPGVPPGDYIVFFDAADTAWVDELGGDIVCPELACDVVALGTVTAIAAGGNTLDAALARLAISGSVVDDLGQAMANVAVDVLDADGLLVQPGAAFTDAGGSWYKTLPGPGTYFVRTVGEWTPGHQPEIWDDVPCDNCYGPAWGTPIAVNTAPVTGIDFQLEPRPQVIFGGSVVKAADGITPVHPVTVRLLDPISGAPSGWTAETDPGGRYVFADVPVGPYLVHFDAHGEAEAYTDELFADVPCPDLACDAAGQGQVVQILPGESSLHVDLWAPTTLSGTIVDADDPATPVYPVIIDLVDTETFDPIPGLQVGNNPDGSYLFEDVPPGEYLLFFNAMNEANGFIDQFNDGTPCNDGVCDRTVARDPITLEPGPNTLDLAMRDIVYLSGHVTDEFGAPLEGVPVEVYNELGEPVCGGAVTDADGYWTVCVPPYQDYWVRIANVDLGGLVPEVWNDIPCEDCDPLAAGMPITVEGADVEDIDFQLSPPAELLTACSADSGLDTIFSSGFETSPTREIQWVTPPGGLITAPGDSVELEVMLFDETGAPIDAAGLVWCLTDDTLIELDTTGSQAVLTATAFELGSVDVVVRDPVSGVRARGVVVFAELQTDAAVIDGGLLIQGETPPIGGTRLLRLARTAETEALQVGDVIAVDAQETVFGRIVAITVLATEIEFMIEPAGVRDFFARLDLETESAPISFEIVQEQPGVAAQMRVQSGDVAWTQELAPADIPCTGSLANLSLDAIPFRFNGKFTLKHIIREDDFDTSLNELRIWAEGFAGVEFPNVELKLEIGPKVRCEWDLPALPTPARIGIFKILELGLDVVPKIGVEASLTSPNSIVAQTPRVVAGLKMKAGLAWSELLGFEPVAAFEPDVQYTPGSPPTTANAYEFVLKPYGGAALEIGAEAWPWSYKAPMIRFENGMPISIKLEQPISPTDPTYKGFTWSVTDSFEVKYDPQIADFVQNYLSVYLGVPPTIVGVDLNVPLYKSERLLLQNPQLSLDASCIYASFGGADCDLDPAGVDRVAYRMQLEPLTGLFTFGQALLSPGSADLVGWRDGGLVGEQLQAEPVFDPFSPLKGNWDPSELQTGQWKLAGRISDIDWISAILPYPTNAFEPVKVGLLKRLNVTTDGQGAVTLVASGAICAGECLFQFGTGNPVQLVAAASPGWRFHEWRSDGECGGSNAKTCDITMDVDKSAIAVFDPWPIVTVERRDGDSPTTTAGAVTSSPAGILCDTNPATAICAAPVEGSVLLKATPSEGKVFDRWENCQAPSGEQCTLTPAVDTTVVAVFRDKPKTLIVDKVDGGGVLTLLGQVNSSPAGIDCGPDCEAEFVNFATVQLTASEFGGWQFLRWHEDSEACAGSTDPFCVVPMVKDVNRVKAVFSPGSLELNVQRVREDGSVAGGGRVVSDPGGIDCGVTCQASYEYNSYVALNAEEPPGWFFIKWADDSPNCAGSTNRTCVVRMTTAQSAKAVFEPFNYELAVMGRLLDYSGGSSGYYEHEVLQDGQSINLLPGGLYHFRLKLNGEQIPVTCFNSPSFEDEGSCHDLGGPEPCLASPSTAGFVVRFVRNQVGYPLVYGGPNYTAPGVTITLHDAVNDRPVTFTFDATVVTAQYQAVNGQVFNITDSQGVPTGGTVTYQPAVRDTSILAGYRGVWTATEPWGRENSTSGIWLPWFRDELHTFTRYICPDQSERNVVFYGATQLYETVYCNNQTGDWLICTNLGCATSPEAFLICPN